MSTNYYQLYIDDTIAFAKTLCIKSTASADAINILLIYKYGNSVIDTLDQTTWKYYKNICGLYHPTDSIISVTSLDTLEIIAFTKENLAIHTATKRAYQFGERNYKELVNKYPEYEQLILGILYPADMSTAVSAPDGTILSYPSIYVESNEISLITDLQNWINNFKIRWDITPFVLLDSLYAAAQFGVMILNIVPAILNIRLKKCKTNEAHTFHIKQYLASHGFLDNYFPYLSKNQILFFYKNICYIEHNSGKNSTFDWLVENTMTNRHLPLSGFTMRHNQAAMPANILPAISFRRTNISGVIDPTEKSIYTLDEIISKENNLATDNIVYNAEHNAKIKSDFEYSQSSVVNTKLLESSIIDNSDAVVYSVEEVLLCLWMTLIDQKLYNTYISFKNPTNGINYALSATDAYIYYVYCLTKALGSKLTTVPEMYLLRLPKNPRPTVDDLMKVADTKYISRDKAQQILDMHPTMHNCITLEAFNTLGMQYYNANINQLGLISTEQHYYTRALVENMTLQLYGDKTVRLPATDMPFEQWLISKNLPNDVYTTEGYLTLQAAIFEAATGYKADSFNYLGNMQKAMISILKQFSSYSVQFTSKINANKIKVIDAPVIRVGDIRYKAKGITYLPDLNVNVNSMFTTSKVIQNINTTQVLKTMLADITQTARYKFSINTKPSWNINRTRIKNVPISATMYTTASSPIDSGSYNNITTVVGYDTYVGLSATQKNSIKDIYVRV